MSKLPVKKKKNVFTQCIPTFNLATICSYLKSCEWKKKTWHWVNLCSGSPVFRGTWRWWFRALICYGQGHSTLIICQFRTVRFLVNILFSGKNLCLIPLCLIIGACVNLGQRTGITDEWRLPPVASASFLSWGIICRDWMRRRRRVKTADEAQSFNEGWDTTVIYLSVTQTPFIIALPPTTPPPQKASWRESSRGPRGWGGKDEEGWREGHGGKWDASFI